MAKVSGLGAQLLVADAGGTPRDISNDVTDFSLSTPVALQDVTGVNKSAHEKLALLADLTAQLKGVANFAANMSHAVLSTATSSPVQRACTAYPTSNHSTPVLPFNALIANYDMARGNDGALTWQSNLNLSDGSVPTWALLVIINQERDVMGFDLSTTGRILTFENTPYAGLTVKCDEAPIGLLTDVTKDYSKLSGLTPGELAVSPDGAALLERLMENFAVVLEEWDLTRRGEPVPPTLDGIRSVGSAFFLALLQAWLTGTVQADEELGKDSSSGASSAEAQTAAAALSQSLPSSGPPRSS